jgi:hypothetical protein
MHMQQRNDRDVRREFQLNVIPQANQHSDCEIPFDSIENPPVSYSHAFGGSSCLPFFRGTSWFQQPEGPKEGQP